MTFSFRIRIDRAPGTTVNIDDPVLPLSTGREEQKLSLRAVGIGDKSSIKSADCWAVWGEGYPSEEIAEKEGRRVYDALQVALTKSRIGFDLGARTSRGGVLTAYGQRFFSERMGARVLNNLRGLMVFESDPAPRFMNMEMVPVIQKNPNQFTHTLLETLEKSPILSSAERAALAIFGASYFDTRTDGRFLLLIVALEAILEPLPKSDAAIELVDGFIQATAISPLAKAERDSLIGSLRHLKNESISKTGERVARDFLSSKYENLSADDFFRHIYRTRSNLVHGNEPIPSYEQVSRLVGETERFVSDLIVAVIERKIASD